MMIQFRVHPDPTDSVEKRNVMTSGLTNLSDARAFAIVTSKGDGKGPEIDVRCYAREADRLTMLEYMVAEIMITEGTSLKDILKHVRENVPDTIARSYSEHRKRSPGKMVWPQEAPNQDQGLRVPNSEELVEALSKMSPASRSTEYDPPKDPGGEDDEPHQSLMCKSCGAVFDPTDQEWLMLRGEMEALAGPMPANFCMSHMKAIIDQHEPAGAVEPDQLQELQAQQKAVRAWTEKQAASAPEVVEPQPEPAAPEPAQASPTVPPTPIPEPIVPPSATDTPTPAPSSPQATSARSGPRGGIRDVYDDPDPGMP